MLTRRLAPVACLLLASCASGSGDVRATAPPPSLTAPCPGAADLPARALTDQEVEVLWGRDRSALRACASRHGALADWATTATDAEKRKPQ